MQRRRIFQHITAAIVMLSFCLAQAGDDFPGAKPDRRILRTQQKADSLFEKGDFERAYFIYREELSPLGDKYAQYMVGYMNLVGKGVSSDLIAGSAWYRLAAERGDSSFKQASDEVLRLLDDEQRRLSDQRYFELRQKYSDAMIVAALVEKDLDSLQNRVEVNALVRDPVDVATYNNDNPAKRDAEAEERIAELLGFLQKARDKTGLLAAEELQRIELIESRAEVVLGAHKRTH